MGRGTWYYSLGVSSIIDAFVRSYLLSGATNSSEANGIIRNPKLELESFCFTFDLVPFSYGKRLYCLVGRKVTAMPFGLTNAPAVFMELMSQVCMVVYRQASYRRVTEGREDVREVFQQRGSGAKRKLS
ncbi:hypothetical protein Tco_0225169, partial [Tanacetum coccineum]